MVTALPMTSVLMVVIWMKMIVLEISKNIIDYDEIMILMVIMIKTIAMKTIMNIYRAVFRTITIIVIVTMVIPIPMMMVMMFMIMIMILILT